MDNDKFHNANIIRNKLSLKNNEISQDQLERKVLQYEIEKLKLEKEIMRLAFENENLKKEVKEIKIENESGQLEEKNEKLALEKEIMRLGFENENLKKEVKEIKAEKSESEKLTEENEVLKKQVEELNSKKDSRKLEEENEKLKKEVSNLTTDGKTLTKENERLQNEIERLQKNQPATVKLEVNSKLVTMKDRLIEQGVRRFIECIEPETKVYDSYVKWYEDITERMENGVTYEYDKYLFLRQEFEPRKDGKKFRIEYRSHRTDSGMLYVGFETKTLDQGWTNENIKMVLLLHPKNPQQFYELNYKMEDHVRFKQKDADGKLLYHYWQSAGDVKLQNSRILCCIKY